jgi:integrase
MLIRDSLAENSRRAYLSDLAEFERWGGSIPASTETVAAYLADRADKLSVATLVRHLASISKAHEAHGPTNPTRSELVRATLRGIRRTKGCAQREAKPLLRDDLLLVLDAMGDRLKDVRDRVLLLIGLAGALRRSELVGLDVGDVEGEAFPSTFTSRLDGIRLGLRDFGYVEGTNMIIEYHRRLPDILH